MQNTQYESFKEVLVELADVVKVEAPAVKTVVWEYYNVDGTLIASFSF